MNAEDTASDVPQLSVTLPSLTLTPNHDGRLSTVESSVTEFYSCYSESIHTNTSLFCSLTSFPSIEEDHKSKDCHGTLLAPYQSSEEQGSNASMPEVAEKVSFSVEDETSRKKSVCTGVVTDGQLPSPDFPNEVVMGKRSESCVFQVTLVQGLMGVGLTLCSDDLKEVAVQKIRMFSAAAIQGQLRSVNSS